MTTALKYPKLRPVEVHHATHQGQPVILLQDPLQLSDQSFLVHQPLAAVLAFFDGQHSLLEIENSLKQLAGIELDSGTLAQLVESLDGCYLLESDRYHQAVSTALEEYHQATYRPSLLSGHLYPEEPEELRAWLDSFVPKPIEAPLGTPSGFIVPHLDYDRGGQIYANVFHAGREALTQADLVVIFGTDHHGPAIAPTLTRQDYATPLGVAPTALSAVEELQAASIDANLFEHELYHQSEHSIELALIWTQHILDGKQVEILPILAGSVHEYIEGLAETVDNQLNQNLADAFRRITADKNVAVIASGDLAHVGPAFGGEPVDQEESDRLLGADMEKIDRLCEIDPDGFLELIRQDQNQDNICGSAPIYRLLTWQGYKRGYLLGYTQCDADIGGSSLVSACGIAYEK